MELLRWRRGGAKHREKDRHRAAAVSPLASFEEAHDRRELRPSDGQQGGDLEARVPKGARVVADLFVFVWCFFVGCFDRVCVRGVCCLLLGRRLNTAAAKKHTLRTPQKTNPKQTHHRLDVAVDLAPQVALLAAQDVDELRDDHDGALDLLQVVGVRDLLGARLLRALGHVERGAGAAQVAEREVDEVDRDKVARLVAVVEASFFLCF